MAGTIDIHLDTNLYKAPTQQDVKDAKRFVLLRNDNSATLADLIEELIRDAAREITLVCYKYNIRPQEFQFTANESMMREVYDILDKLEEDIYGLVLVYSLNVTKDKDRRQLLLPFLLALKSKDTANLRDTLHARMMQLRYDLEAQIAAMMLVKLPEGTAVSRVLSTLHSVYSSQEMLAAFRKRSAATNIKMKGVHEGGQGLSSSGAVNVENFGRMTAILTWSKSKYYDYREMTDIAGFYTLRGSSYDCPLCDSKVGFHTIYDADAYPPFHGHCCCYAIPILMRNDFT